MEVGKGREVLGIWELGEGRIIKSSSLGYVKLPLSVKLGNTMLLSSLRPREEI